MRIFLYVLFMPLFLLGQEGKTALGKINFFLGSNYVKSTQTERWQPAKFNMQVFEFDRVKTEKESRSEIEFQKGKVLRIGENSEVEITRDKAGFEQVNMKSGSGWISMFLPKGASQIFVRTPSSVCGIRGTVYRLDADQNHTAYRCYQGTIEVTPFEKDGKTLSDSTFKIDAGEELILVMNFEEYRKQQEKAIKDYMDQDQEDFEDFMKQDQEDFEEQQRKDAEEFQRVNNMFVKQNRFDPASENNSSWVRWNQERDRQLQEN